MRNKVVYLKPVDPNCQRMKRQLYQTQELETIQLSGSTKPAIWPQVPFLFPCGPAHPTNGSIRFESKSNPSHVKS